MPAQRKRFWSVFVIEKEMKRGRWKGRENGPRNGMEQEGQDEYIEMVQPKRRKGEKEGREEEKGDFRWVCGARFHRDRDREASQPLTCLLLMVVTELPFPASPTAFSSKKGLMKFFQ
jgi:hypothetical protein